MATPATSMKFASVCRTIQINGKQHYLWRAVNQDEEVVDVYLKAKRDEPAVKLVFKRLRRHMARSLEIYDCTFLSRSRWK